MRMFQLGGAALATLIAVGSAQAADLPARPAPAYKAPAMAPAWTWTGCYVGVEGGGVWGHNTQTSTTPPTTGLSIVELHPSGGLIGGTLGCNYQFTNVVIGIENDISWQDLQASSADLLPFNQAFSHSIRSDWLDTLRGRLGVTFDRALFYVTGGAAFTQLKDNATGPGATVLGTANVTGWTVGGGIEYMFDPSWSAKVEYLYVQFPTTHFPFDTASGGFFVGTDSRLTENVVRAGINYHFDWSAH